MPLHSNDRRRVNRFGRVSHRALVIAALLIPLGCRSATHTASGAATGAGVGALAGAVIGSKVGKPLQGAAIAGAAGGVIGGTAGAAQDLREQEEERSADERYRQTLAIAMTNSDVLQMFADGQSEDVILNAVQKGIANFDTSPEALAIVRAAGVSDRVIIAMQDAPRVRRPVTMKSVR